MKRRIISIIVLGVVTLSLVGCGDKEKVSIEDKKKIVSDLQEEIKQEDVIKVKEKLSKEDFLKFRNAFNSWNDFYFRSVIGMRANEEGNVQIIQNANDLMNNLMNTAPKGNEKDMEKLKELSEDYINFLDKDNINGIESMREGGKIYEKLIEVKDKVKNYVNKDEE